MTLNDLECAIHLKVRLMDGTLDVYVCCGFRIRPYALGVARRGGGGLEVPIASPMWAADALFLCGS